MTNEEPVTGSTIKMMKIKFINPSPISSVPASTNSQELPPDKNCESPDSDHPVPTMTQTPDVVNSSASSMGKRRKKPKQMDDGVLGHIIKKRRRYFPKSDHVGSSHGKSTSRKKSDEVKTPAMIRAEEFKATLSSDFPIFTRLMTKSHVDNGFWMGIPGYFSKQYLPTTDTAFILVTETGKEYELTYNGPKRGLSAGWRNFSVQENLQEDDVLIFQLVEPSKFKVYLVKANDFNELDGALSLLNLEAQLQPENAAKLEKDSEEDCQKPLSLTTYKRRRTKSLKTGSLMLIDKKKRLRRSVPKLANKPEKGFERAQPRSSLSHEFNTITNYEDFSIVVDGLCIDSELPEAIRARYYDLCSMRNDLLHAQLGQGLNSKLIAGMICETIDTFEGIRNCSVMTSREQLTNWDKTLKSFELLGMKVGFLRERVRRLIEVGFESDGALEMRKHVEAKLGKIRAEEEIANLENKIVELREASEKYNEDIEALKFKAESFELKFQEAVNDPW